MKQRWWLTVSFAGGFAFSDLWHSWWNLLVPLGVVAACLTVMIVRARCGERSTRNPRGLPAHSLAAKPGAPVRFALHSAVSRITALGSLRSPADGQPPGHTREAGRDHTL